LGIIRKLASQTAIYGISSIFGRFLNYLLVPLYTYYFRRKKRSVSEFYAYAGFFSVLLLFGFETGYFGFETRSIRAGMLLTSTALIFVVLVNLAFFWLFCSLIQDFGGVNYANHPVCVVLYPNPNFGCNCVYSLRPLRAEDKAFRLPNQGDRNTDNGIAQSIFYYLLPVYAENRNHG